MLAVVALAATMVMAGCTGAGEANKATNGPPDAKLTVNKHKGNNTDSFKFDGRESTDDSSNITSWRFSFGDGTTYEAVRKDEAQVSHKYVHGGEYTVTLTVTDDGGENQGQLTDTTTQTIAVNQNDKLAQQAVNAGPNNVTGESRTPLKVYKGADSFELTVSIQSTMVVGSSEFEVQFVDPDGTVLKSKTQTVEAQKTEEVKIDGEISDEGDHTVVVIARSGGGVMNGESRIMYDRGFQD